LIATLKNILSSEGIITNGESEMAEKNKRKNILITGLTSLLTDISSEMIYPIIALFLKALGGSPAILGIIEGVAESTASILKVFSGAFAD